jgi:hypothetical protein
MGTMILQTARYAVYRRGERIVILRLADTALRVLACPDEVATFRMQMGITDDWFVKAVVAFNVGGLADRLLDDLMAEKPPRAA